MAGFEVTPEDQTLSAKQATLEGDGRSFEQIAQERRREAAE